MINKELLSTLIVFAKSHTPKFEIYPEIYHQTTTTN